MKSELEIVEAVLERVTSAHEDAVSRGLMDPVVMVVEVSEEFMIAPFPRDYIVEGLRKNAQPQIANELAVKPAHGAVSIILTRQDHSVSLVESRLVAKSPTQPELN